MYTDINKCFIQFMLNKGCVTYMEASYFIQTFLEHTKEQNVTLETVVSQLNQNIADHLFRLMFTKCEVTGNKYCCLVNTGNDDISRLPVQFTTLDYELFQIIINEIILTDTRFLTGIYSLNLVSKCKTAVSKDDMQKKINNYCDAGYLVKNDGNIYLGPRTILEYDDYFKKEFSERIVTCPLCSNTVYFGEICSHCNHMMHKSCMDTYRSHNSSNICPKCKNEWEASLARRFSNVNLEQEEQSQEYNGTDTMDIESD